MPATTPPPATPGQAARLAASAPCPCGGFERAGASYAACCARWHQGSHHLLAPTPEALMRSRYAAYVLNLTDYLFQTWHPRTRPSQIEPTAAGVKWLGLTIKAASAVVPGSSDTADHATVTFLARSRHGGRAQRMHECSRFERDELGRWMYVDGVFLK